MRKVTEENIKFDTLTDKYWECFHKSYGIVHGDARPLSEHIRIMEDALRTGVPAEIPWLNPPSNVDL